MATFGLVIAAGKGVASAGARTPVLVIALLSAVGLVWWLVGRDHAEGSAQAVAAAAWQPRDSGDASRP